MNQKKILLFSIFFLLFSFYGENKEFKWDGILLGIYSQIKIIHHNPEEAQKILLACSKYLRFIEKEISFYQKNNCLNRINKYKFLNNPSKEFLEIINKAQIISKESKGLFDITIHPYFKSIVLKKSKSEINKSYKLVDYKKIIIKNNYIKIGKNQQISLNGLGQGFLADKAYNFLKDKIKYALIYTGEYRCIGSKNWQISVFHKGILHNFSLKDGNSLAVSDSKNSLSLKQKSTENYLVVVIGKSACKADALATVYACQKNFKRNREYKVIIFE